MSPEQLLADFAPEVRDLAGRLRVLIRDLVPGVTERAYPGWRGIGYRDEQAGYFCGIFPRNDHVRLLFEHGGALPDAAGLLRGDGRQTRYLRLDPGQAVPEAEIGDLLDEALRYGSVRGSA